MSNVTGLCPVLTQRFVDNTGAPLVNGQVFTYQAGTSTPAPTYTDSTGNTQNTNPIVLNARGEANIWVTPNVSLKFVVQDQFGNIIDTTDQVINSQLLNLFAGVDTGVANAYIVNFNSPYSAYTNGEVLYFIPANANTGASTINVNGLGVVSIINQNGSALAANELLAGQVATILYYNGNFLLIQGAQQGLVSWGGNDTGTTNAYVVALTNQYFAYQPGNVLFFIPSNTNTGASTINVKGLGPQNIFGPTGGTLQPGWITSGNIAEIIYTGTSFRLVNPTHAFGTFTCTATGFSGTAPTITFDYVISNGVMAFISTTGISGPSNATTFTLTGWPNGLQHVTRSTVSPLVAAQDNNTLGISAYITIPSQSGGSTVTVSINNSTGNWTGANTKGLQGFSMAYPMI
jgi:hypothetical protein